MPSVYTLPINDTLAGPSLEIVRRLLQPKSRALPHVTVRYSKADPYIPEATLYRDFVADDLVLLEPATFDHQGSQSQSIRTLFFRCESDQLEYLQYKPDFPQSVFHISIYDGPPSLEAAAALEILRDYPWRLTVPLPSTRLLQGTQKLPQDIVLSADAYNRLIELGHTEDVFGREWPVRAGVIRDVCDALHRGLPSVPMAASIHSEPLTRKADPEQGAFWSRLELMDPETRMQSESAERAALRRRGSFITPPEVAYDIVEAASSLWGPRSVHFGDPSTGGGIFLATLLRQVGASRISAATLIEADPTSAGIAAERWAHLGYEVFVDDFVSRILSTGGGSPGSEEVAPWVGSQPSLLITNPPYVRSQALDDAKVEKWRESIRHLLGIKIDRRADLYVYFVLAAHKWLQDGAVATWLLPSEFMFTNYGAGLRRYLTQEVSLRRVHLYDGPSVFANARVTSCAVFYEKRGPNASDVVEFSVGGTVARPHASHRVAVHELAGAHKWHRVADEGVYHRAPHVTNSRVSDHFDVRRGIATGANDQFIVDEQTARGFGKDALQWLKPVLPRARQLAGPVVEADDDGRPRLPDVRWLIDCGVSLDEIRKVSPELAEYLLRIEPTVMSRTLVRRRKLFYRQELNRPSLFFFSYMSRDMSPSRRFYLNRSRAIALNNFITLSPRPHLRQWIDQCDGRDFEVLTALRKLDPAEMEREGRVYVEGLTKVEPRELGALHFDIASLTKD